jgi:MFS family permease
MLAVFLSALDQVSMHWYSGLLHRLSTAQTIVATALPTIVKDIGGGSLYSWVGSAYLLAAASLSPLYGRLSDIVGKVCHPLHRDLL